MSAKFCLPGVYYSKDPKKFNKMERVSKGLVEFDRRPHTNIQMKL